MKKKKREKRKGKTRAREDEMELCVVQPECNAAVWSGSTTLWLANLIGRRIQRLKLLPQRSVVMNHLSL